MRWFSVWPRRTPIFEVGQLPEPTLLNKEGDGARYYATAWLLRSLLGEVRRFWWQTPLVGEFGCGSGELVAQIAQCCPRAKIVAVDVKARMQAEIEALELKNVRFQHASLADLSCFDDESFAVIACQLTVGYLSAEEFEAAAAEFVRVLRPGACLLVLDSHPDADARFAYAYRGGHLLQPEETLVLLSEQAPAPDSLVERDAMYMRGELVIPATLQRAGLGLEQLADTRADDGTGIYRVYSFRKANS